MIAAFKNYEIDMESIYTLLIYLQLGIIRSAFSDITTAYEKFRIIAKSLVEQETLEKEPDQSVLINQFTENQGQSSLEYNKDVLNEILTDIWDRDNRTSEIKWMEQWEYHCRKLLDHLEFDYIFKFLSELIFEHLGISNEENRFKLSVNLIE